MKQMWKNKQTWGVWLSVVLFGIEGLMLFVAFIALTIFGGLAIIHESLPLVALLTSVSFVLLLIALFFIFVSWNLLAHKQWAWIAAMVIWAFNMLLSITTEATFLTYMISLIIPVIAIVGLIMKDTTKLFNLD